MNRISIFAFWTVVGCFAFNSAAIAAPVTATSTSTATVAKKCSITTEITDILLVASSTTINGASFPIELTSNGNPGKFTTLCNTSSSGIAVRVTSVPNAALIGGGPYTTTYSLSATAPSAYVGNAILGTEMAANVIRNGTIGHSFSSSPSELLVSSKVKPTSTTQVLADGEYTVTIRATLTP